MGLFKETLHKYIRNQFETRQEVISTHKNRSGLNGGAFHAFTVSKYCNLRMASCVDIVGSELLDMDLKLGNIQLERDYVGSGLAKNYILQGGTLLYPKGAKTPAMRRGFPGQGRPLGGAYGDPLMRGDAKDGYGIVPMPGITKMNIRTKSAYGSLREAKVDFTCHNLRQLAVLELLYMKPGYPVLLEWGWDPYIKTKNNKITVEKQGELGWISDKPAFWGQKLKGGPVGSLSQGEIANLINDKRKESGGNYDAIVGLCKNFSYSARPDGGFNCTTELMSVGEVLTTLKGKTLSYKISEGTQVGDTQDSVESVSEITLPTLLDLLQKTHDFKYNLNTRDVKFIDGTDLDRYTEIRRQRDEGDDDEIWNDDDNITTGKHFNMSREYHKPVTITGNGPLNPYSEAINQYNIPRKELEQLYAASFLNQQAHDGTPLIKDHVHIWHFKENRTGWQKFLSLTGWAAGAAVGHSALIMNLITNYQNSNLGCTEAYIRLDALCYMINKYCIPPLPRKKEERINSFQCIHYNPAKGKYYMNQMKSYEQDLKDLMKNSLSFIPALDEMPQIMDCSVDPYVCMMPKQQTNDDVNIMKQQYLPVENSFGFYGGHFKSASSQFPQSFKNEEETKRQSLQSVGHISLNVKFLLKCHDKIYGEAGRQNKDYSIGKFMAKVIEGINQTMAGGVKLGLVTDNDFPSITSIVDLNQAPQTQYKDVFRFNVLSNDTVVRNFSFNSAIPSSMAATIAIGAGDPDNADSLDAVTFAAMNRGVKNRLFQKQTKQKIKEPITAEEREEAQKTVRNQVKRIGDISHNLYEWQLKIVSGHIFQDRGEEGRNKKGNVKTELNELQNLLNIVATKDSDGLIPPPSSNPQNPPTSTPIPIKLDMTFDGIAGLTMGQLFRVHESRLPQAYRKKNIIFVVVAEDQNVDDKGNWTTKISGQMQLFPSKPEAQLNQATTNNPSLINFDPQPFAERFFDALDGWGTDTAEMDKLYSELNHDKFVAVMNYWDLAPNLNQGKGDLLYWIDDDEDGERYDRWDRLARGSKIDFPKPAPAGGAGNQNRCFVAGTKISMANNINKNIEDIVIGDLVKAFDTNTNTIINSSVLKTFIHPDNKEYYIINNNLKVTGEHPMWVNKDWKAVNTLQIGDKLLHLDGSDIEIESIEIKQEISTVYNFEVDNVHNYYAEEMLSHNKPF